VGFLLAFVIFFNALRVTSPIDSLPAGLAVKGVYGYCLQAGVLYFLN
jgi:hypothetical protein